MYVCLSALKLCFWMHMSVCTPPKPQLRTGLEAANYSFARLKGVMHVRVRGQPLSEIYWKFNGGVHVARI